MFKPALAPLVILCSFSSSAFSQPQSSVPVSVSVSVEAARRQTASALRAVLPSVADVDDVTALARLGDFEAARRVAQRAEDGESKATWLALVAQEEAKSALRHGQADEAEKKILSINGAYGAASLWVEVSRLYSQVKRPSDACRTALYAATQVRREKGTYSWPDVALRLCEVGERPAARRLFAVAQKELLDPDPLWGSPLDTVIQAAAR